MESFTAGGVNAFPCPVSAGQGMKKEINMSNIKTVICTVTGVGGALITSLFGGWSVALTTLCIFMLVDYITGIIVAAVFKKSEKSENGGLESRAGFKGLIKKGMIFAVIIISYRLDLMLGTDYIKNVVIIAFSANELISITENAALMGVPMPTAIKKAIDLLKERGEGE